VRLPATRHRFTVGLAGAGLLVLAGNALAELTVIYDNGQTQSIAEFLGPMQMARSGERASPSENQRLGAAEARRLLPIRSPGLTPGALNARAHGLPYLPAFFLLGSDAWSRRWLTEHRDLLKELGAVGLLVEASSLEDLEAIATLADGLPITPASGSDIGAALKISHYPCAVSDGHIWQ
jgi:integrating conjugative element protein (TIGR03765 family)